MLVNVPIDDVMEKLFQKFEFIPAVTKCMEQPYVKVEVEAATCVKCPQSGLDFASIKWSHRKKHVSVLNVVC